MLAERVSSTSPFRQMMRSFSRREKMSEVCQPPPWFVSDAHTWIGGWYECVLLFLLRRA